MRVIDKSKFASLLLDKQSAHWHLVFLDEYCGRGSGFGDDAQEVEEEEEEEEEEKEETVVGGKEIDEGSNDEDGGEDIEKEDAAVV